MEVFTKESKHFMVNQLAESFMNRIAQEVEWSVPLKTSVLMSIYDMAYDAFAGLPNEEIYHRFMSEPAYTYVETEVKTAS